MLAADGLHMDEMLALALEEDASSLSCFKGCHIYPIYPGAAASCVASFHARHSA
jgi:hypothetical protein